MKSRALLVALLLVPAVAKARLDGRVVDVEPPVDLVIQDKAGVKRKIRMVALGLPKEGNAKYDQAFSELRKLALNRQVSVDTMGPAPGCTDGACATYGRVSFSGVDPAIVLLRKGLAFHDRKQMSEQSTTDRMLYTEAQADAQKHRRGVWRSPDGDFEAPPATEPPPKKAPAPPSSKKKKKRKADGEPSEGTA